MRQAHEIPSAGRKIARRHRETALEALAEPEVLHESVAICGGAALDRHLETGRVEERDIAELVRRRVIFPRFFGSTLRLEGVDALLDALARYTMKK